MNDELLDIVDKNDHVIGQKYRSEIWHSKSKNFRVINAFLVNNQKQVWIPRRSPDKKLFPLCLDASVGGHVSAGESYQEAFERELLEELNIIASQISYRFLTKITPYQYDVSAYMHMYSINTNVSPNYNKNDFINAEWISIPELLEKIKTGEKTKGDLPLLITMLQKFI